MNILLKFNSLNPPYGRFQYCTNIASNSPIQHFTDGYDSYEQVNTCVIFLLWSLLPCVAASFKHYISSVFGLLSSKLDYFHLSKWPNDFVICVRCADQNMRCSRKLLLPVVSMIFVSRDCWWHHHVLLPTSLNLTILALHRHVDQASTLFRAQDLPIQIWGGEARSELGALQDVQLR